ncbi:MAG: cyclic nucleotide-binding domain-containing protein [Proteobacteria bacterium]|nr:cyclic nucleotide-binding domain-containing protein [Pseudomonadota bacterium]MCP4918655.1 cyclic nucleotide-binding domain-containing protein [Pseudomonadota bacterium]
MGVGPGCGTVMDVAELQKLPIFGGASRARLSEALAAFIPCEIGPGEVLMREGESDRAMVLLLQGEASVHIGESRLELTRIGPGELVGDMALFGNIDRRAATVISSKPCQVLLLDEQGLKYLRMKRSPVVPVLERYALGTIARRLRETDRLIASVAVGQPTLPVPRQGLFRKLGSMFKGPAGDPPEALTVLEASDAFRDQSPRIVAELATQVEVVGVRSGDILFEEHDDCDESYIVAHGCIDMHVTTLRDSYELVARLRGGTALGFCAMVDGGGRVATAVAAEDTWLLRLDAELFAPVGEDGDPMEETVMRRAAFNAINTHLRLTNAHVEFLQGRLNGHALDPRFRPL